MGSCALRWTPVEAAQKSVLGGGPLRQRFERIAKRRGRNVAKVAVARQILTLCYYGLRDVLNLVGRARLEPWRPHRDRRRQFDCAADRVRASGRSGELAESHGLARRYGR